MKKTIIILFVFLSSVATAVGQDAAQTILAQADSLSEVKKYNEAIALIEKNISLFNTNSADDAFAYSYLGSYYYNLNNFSKAIDSYREYVRIRKPYAEQQPENYAAWLVNTISNTARCYGKLSDYKSAILTYNEAIEQLDKYKDNIKDYPKEKASKLGSLAWYYIFNKEYKNAEEAVLKGLETDSTQTWIKTNLAHALLFQGKVLEAETLYNKLGNTIYDEKEKITYSQTLLDDFEQFEQEKIIPENHKINAEKIKANLEKLREGELIYKDFWSLIIKEKNEEAISLIQAYKGIFPEQHAIWIGNIFGNIGQKIRDRGDYTQAEKYYLEAKNIYEKVLGKEHPDYATSLSNLGYLYNAIGDYTQAEKYYLEAKNIYEKALGKEHPDYATSLNNLGLLYNNIGDYTQAEKYYVEAKNIREKALGKEHPSYAASLINLGYLYNAIGDYTQAEKYYLEAKKCLGKSARKRPSQLCYFIKQFGIFI